MQKILDLLEQKATPSLQECYEEFKSTPKIELLDSRDELQNGFENLVKVDYLYHQDKKFAEFFARIYYEVNCRFEFRYICDFLREKDNINNWLSYAKGVLDDPDDFKKHYEVLMDLYKKQVISNIDEEFIYLYLRYCEKTHNILKEYEKKYLSDYLIDLLDNLSSNDYISVRDALLSGFDNFNKTLIHKNLNIECTSQAKLQKGKNIIDTQEQLVCDLRNYGTTHQAKLDSSLEVLIKQKDSLIKLLESADRYITDDPEACVIKLRQFVEFFVNSAYEDSEDLKRKSGLEQKIDNPRFLNFLQKLKQHFSQNFSDAKIKKLLHKIRKTGNRAAHNPDDVTIEDSKEAFMNMAEFINCVFGAKNKIESQKN